MEGGKEDGLFVDLNVALDSLTNYAWGVGTVWDGWLIFPASTQAYAVPFTERPKWASVAGVDGTAKEIREVFEQIAEQEFPRALSFDERGKDERRLYKEFLKVQPGDVISLRNVGTENSGHYLVIQMEPKIIVRQYPSGEPFEIKQHLFDGFYDVDQTIGWGKVES
jgi:hypothetical protein